MASEGGLPGTGTRAASDSVAGAGCAVTNVDLVRIFAVLIVIYGNGLVLTSAPATSYWGAPFARLGLDILFAISGWLSMTAWERRPAAARFLARRALRLAPGLIGCVLATVLVIGPLATRLSLRDYFRDAHTRGYLANIVLVQKLWLPRVFEGQQWVGTVNPMLWTLVAWVPCLLLIPAVGRLPSRRRGWALAATAVVCAAAALILQADDPQNTIQIDHVAVADMLTEAPFFLVAAGLRALGRDTVWRADLAMLCFAANWVTATWLGAGDIVLEWVTLPYMVICFGRLRLPVLGAFGRWGNPSYGCYLFAFPLQQLIVERLPHDPAPILTCVLLALPAGYLSWHLIERPALRWRGPGRMPGPWRILSGAA